ncbi:MAG: UDP-glucose/GDP-mannose dehydrogenase family protein [Candidatus Omnitrophota bacterium]
MVITVIGSGYVGLVSGACFAELGNEVICVDSNRKKIADLKKLIMPIYEPGLKELVERNVLERRLKFSTSIKEAIKDSLVIFIAVGTPPRDNGEADLTFVENVAEEIAENMASYKLIVEKSTVPVETGMWVEHTIRVNIRKNIKFDVASNPEFLREGTAINDFMHPDRIILGVKSKKAENILKELYLPLNAPILVTDIKSAELIKHASNSFLAAKISFINAISQIAEKTGADIEKIAQGIGLDKRIGRPFLDSGLGYGGFCFPKDIDAFIRISQKIGYDFRLLEEVKKINDNQKNIFLKKIKDSLWIIKGKNIGILGLSFKPNTDDMRFAPSIDIINELSKEGAKLKAFDPQAMPTAKKLGLPLKYCNSVYDLVRRCDCLCVITEWNEFKELDFSKIKKLMHQPIIIDGRNMYDKRKLEKIGFKYLGMGR